MQSIINRNMKVEELKNILKTHNIETAYGWEIMLWMIFNTLETDELIVEGFGSNAQIHP